MSSMACVDSDQEQQRITLRDCPALLPTRAPRSVRSTYPAIDSESSMLGGFLLASGVVTAADIIKALALAKNCCERIGEMLFLQGSISRDLLEGAIKVHRMVVCDMLTIDQGLRCLRLGKATSACSYQIIKSASTMVHCLESAADLARQAGVLKEDLDPSTRRMQEVSGLAALEALFVANDLPCELYKAFVQAGSLVEKSSIDKRQAMHLIELCQGKSGPAIPDFRPVDAWVAYPITCLS